MVNIACNIQLPIYIQPLLVTSWLKGQHTDIGYLSEAV